MHPYIHHTLCSADLKCETEGCGRVPGSDALEGQRVGLGPGVVVVDDSEPLRVDEGGGAEGPGGFAHPASMDPYVDFAFGLDVTTRGYGTSPGRTSRPLVPTMLDYPSTSETLRSLESAIGPPLDAETNADLTLVDVDAPFLIASTPQRLSPREGETQRRSLLSSGPLRPLPFHLSTFATSPLLPVATTAHNLALTHLDSNLSLKAPVEIRHQTPRIPATLSGSGLGLGSAKPAAALADLGSAKIQEKVFAGPSLFLDDDSME